MKPQIQNSHVKREEPEPNFSDALPTNVDFENSFEEEKHVLVIPIPPVENIKKELERDSSNVDLSQQTEALWTNKIFSETPQHQTSKSLGFIILTILANFTFFEYHLFIFLQILF